MPVGFMLHKDSLKYIKLHIKQFNSSLKKKSINLSTSNFKKERVVFRNLESTFESI